MQINENDGYGGDKDEKDEPWGPGDSRSHKALRARRPWPPLPWKNKKELQEIARCSIVNKEFKDKAKIEDFNNAAKIKMGLDINRSYIEKARVLFRWQKTSRL